MLRSTLFLAMAAALFALSARPLPAQTQLVVGIAGDGYGYESGEGIYLVQPDLGTWTYVSLEDQVWDVASDAHGFWYCAADGRGNTYLDSAGSWSYDIQTSTIVLGDGPDGYLYCRGYPDELVRVRAQGGPEQDLGPVSGPRISDFAAGPDGSLYCLASGDLYTLDLETRQLTLVADLTQDLYSLGISNDGRFWGIPFWSSKLYSLDPATGQVSYVMDLPPVPGIFFPTYSLGSEPGPFTPMDQVVLTAPATATAGQAVTFDVTNAPADSRFVLLASAGTGYAYAVVQPLGLARPVSKVARGRTDATGVGSLTRIVPPFATGRSFWFEVVVEETGGAIPHLWDSNTVRMDVQ